MMDVLKYYTMPFLLQGAWISIQIAVVAMAGGLVIGLVIALCRLSSFKPMSAAAWFCVWFIRGTPLLLQLVFLYDALPPLGIVLSPMATALIAFTVNQAAYNSEIIRGGILSVNRNQAIAAASLGMGPILTLRRILLPQAMRAIMPALGNESVSLLKMTSLATVVSVNELTQRSSQIVAQNFRFFTVFIATGMLYLTMTSLIAAVQFGLERHFNLQRARAPSKALAERSAPSADRAADIRTVPIAPRTIAHAQPRPVSHSDFVACRGVCKDYGGTRVLAGVDLTVAAGEVVAIIGPSGSGKSTLLRLINHLESLSGGEITVDGKFVGYKRIDDVLRPTGNVARARAEARIAMVFQHFNLFEHKTALENIIEAPCLVYGTPRREAQRRAAELLALVGLSDHADALPAQLSGGQQQRVAIARSLAVDPRLILFDEPTSALDPELVGEVLSVIRNLAHSGITMIIVTHEIRFAMEIADRIVFMDGGVVVEAGDARSLIRNPTTPRLKQFLSSMHVPPTAAVAV